MISLPALIHFVVVVIVMGLIFGLLHWLIGYTNVPEPFAKVARVMLAVVGVLLIIAALLHLIGYPVVRF